jgi:hypothetical protein
VVQKLPGEPKLLGQYPCSWENLPFRGALSFLIGIIFGFMMTGFYALCRHEGPLKMPFLLPRIAFPMPSGAKFLRVAGDVADLKEC